MERAEFAAGSIEVRGSGPVHRVLNFLGAFFLGIGPGVQREKEDGNWWDRDDPSALGSDAVPMSFGRQAELFDDAGRVAVQPIERTETPVAAVRTLPEARPEPKAIAQTIVSVHSKSKSTARVIATTRVVSMPRVSAVAKGTTAARGAVAHQLLMSQSISSGKEESRWFSVPQRVLLPRYQLFEGSDAVTEDGGGRLHVGSPSTRSQHGHVWFV